MSTRVWRTYFVAAAVTLLAACSHAPSNDGGAAAKPVGDMGDSTAVLTLDAVPDIYQAVHTPATGDFVGALADITSHECVQEADGWHVTGTATNPMVATVDYRVFISLVNGVSVTRALVEAEVLGVAGGSTGQFDTVIALPDEDVHCVLRVERHNPGA